MEDLFGSPMTEDEELSLKTEHVDDSNIQNVIAGSPGQAGWHDRS